MGKHKKEHKKESKKRKHRSRSRSRSAEKERKKHHKKHHKEHKDKKREKCKKLRSSTSSGSDDEVIYISPSESPIIKKEKDEFLLAAPPAPPPPKISSVPPPAPKPPKLSAAPPTPKPPKISDAPPTPKPPRLSDAPPTPKPPRLSDAPPTPRISDAPPAPKAPKLSDAPPAPKAPKLSAAPPTPKPPKISSSPPPTAPKKVPKVPSVPPPKAPRISTSSPPPIPPPPSLSSSSPPPTPAPASGSSEASLSIEETNALRAKLGLKPLAVRAETSADGTIKSGGEEFVHKPAESLTSKKQAEKLRARLAERKEKREIEKRLKSVKTLGQAGGGGASDDEDLSSWVKKSRRQEEEKRKAQLKAKELDEMDEVFGIGALVNEEITKEKKASYTAANLRGLTVEHDITNLTEGKDIILTLKDKGVLEEEADALVNVNLLDDERYKKNVEIKKQKPYNYNGIDDGEMEDEEKGVLSKYDEEIDGAKKTKFTIGVDNAAEIIRESVKAKLKEKAKMTLESLNIPAPRIASEYYSQEEMVKFNKPKKKRKIKSRTLKADDLLALSGEGSNENGNADGTKVEVKDEPMDTDEFSPMVFENVRIEEDDDTELQLALKKARRLKLTPPEKLTAKLLKVEDVLSELKEEESDEQGGGAIVLNSTAEFCRTLGDIPTYGLAGNREEGPSVILDFDRENKEKRRQEEGETRSGGWNAVDVDMKEPEVKPTEAPILDAEPDLGAGVGGALRLAVSKGYLEKETVNRPSASRGLSHLAAQNYSIDDKAHQGEDEKMGRRERYCGPTSDFKEKDGYKPNIKLEYIDDDGHLLSAKEAFRYLSHKFHGKGPGKNKVEKRMKKSEQEGLMKQMSSTDTPLGTLQMLQQKQKETHSAFVVLSGTKQTNIPSAISKTKMK